MARENSTACSAKCDQGFCWPSGTAGDLAIPSVSLNAVPVLSLDVESSAYQQSDLNLIGITHTHRKRQVKRQVKKARTLEFVPG
jgi:hypothetical protein